MHAGHYLLRTAIHPKSVPCIFSFIHYVFAMHDNARMTTPRMTLSFPFPTPTPPFPLPALLAELREEAHFRRDFDGHVYVQVRAGMPNRAPHGGWSGCVSVS